VKLESDNFAEYFDAISPACLEVRIESGLLSSDVVKMYKEKLDKAEKSGYTRVFQDDVPISSQMLSQQLTKLNSPTQKSLKRKDYVALPDQEDGDDTSGPKMIEGHESYNMISIPDYSKKFGLESSHMIEYFRTKESDRDYIITQTKFKETDDDDDTIPKLKDIVIDYHKKPKIDKKAPSYQEQVYDMIFGPGNII